MTLKEIKAKYFVLEDNFVKNKYSLHNNVYGSGTYSMHKYIGTITYNSKKQIATFNDVEYKNIELLNDAMIEWGNSLPFNVEYYDTAFRVGVKEKFCIHSYLVDCGFNKTEYGNSYVLKTVNPYFGASSALSITYKVDDDKTSGIIMLTPNNNNASTWIEIKFDDLEDAISKLNEHLKPFFVTYSGSLLHYNSKLNNMMANVPLSTKTTMDCDTMRIYEDDLMDKTISELEKTLSILKSIKEKNANS